VRRLVLIDSVVCHYTSQKSQGSSKIGYNADLGGAQQNIINQQSQFQGMNQGQNAALQNFYTNQMNSQGYTPQERQALNVQGMEGAASGYGAARDAANNRMARTGNSAGYYASNAAMGTNQARTLGEQARENELANTQFKYGQQAAGAQGLGANYGQNLGYLQNLNQIRATLGSLQTSGRSDQGQSGWNILGML
jgi:hypothetical protein